MESQDSLELGEINSKTKGAKTCALYGATVGGPVGAAVGAAVGSAVVTAYQEIRKYKYKNNKDVKKLVFE